MLFQPHRNQRFTKLYTQVIKEFRNAGPQQDSQLGGQGFQEIGRHWVSNCNYHYKTKCRDQSR